MDQSLPTEIIEGILSALPTRDLLLAQRVSRQWQDIILASPALQQKLFMQPVPYAVSSRNPVQVNPLLDSILPSFYRRTDFRRSVYRDGGWGVKYPWPQGEAGGEALMADDLALNRMFWADYDSWDRTWRTEAMEWLKARPALLRAEASWRRMFAAQPPPRLYAVADECCDCCGGMILERDRGTMNDDLVENRARLGTLYDLVISFAEQDLADMCSIAWFVGTRNQEGRKDGSPEPFILVRNVTWRSCSAPRGGPGNTGVKITDFDRGCMSWTGEKYINFNPSDLHVGCQREEEWNPGSDDEGSEYSPEFAEDEEDGDVPSDHD
jgi:hypothetical protein